jgi:hypothetical protein
MHTIDFTLHDLFYLVWSERAMTMDEHYGVLAVAMEAKCK